VASSSWAEPLLLGLGWWTELGAVLAAPAVASALAWGAWMPLGPPASPLLVEAEVPAPREVRARRAGDAVSLSWPRRFLPTDGPSALAFAGRDRARASLLEADRAGPALVAVGGFGMGWASLDRRVLALDRFRARGVTVAHYGLPLHGPDAPWFGVPAWPGPALELTRAALAVAAHEVRELVAYLRARGYGPVTVLGVSLGALVSALGATAAAPADALIALTPMIDYARLLRDHAGPLAAGPIEGIAATLGPVSPLARPPVLAPGRTLVMAASDDRLAPCASHAEPLARHFGGDLHVFAGPHLAAGTSPEVERAAFAFLDRVHAGLR
jgi:hypothetical protein